MRVLPEWLCGVRKPPRLQIAKLDAGTTAGLQRNVTSELVEGLNEAVGRKSVGILASLLLSAAFYEMRLTWGALFCRRNGRGDSLHAAPKIWPERRLNLLRIRRRVIAGEDNSLRQSSPSVGHGVKAPFKRECGPFQSGLKSV